MQELSKSLRQRLSAKKAPQEHPDADTLTAFMEQALSSEERGSVVLHLSQCSYCREVISLALPQPVAEQPVAALAPRARLWAPVLRWGAALATVALAAALVIQKPWKMATPARLATTPAQSAGPQSGPISNSAEFSSSSSQPVDSSASSLLPGATASASASSAPAAANLAEAQIDRKPEPVVSRASVDQGRPIVPGSSSGAAPAPPNVMPSPSATEELSEVTGHDYINTKVLQQDSGIANGTPVSNLAPSAANSDSGVVAGRTMNFPPITPDSIQSRAFALTITPPKGSPNAPLSSEGSSLKQSKWAFIPKVIDRTWMGIEKSGLRARGVMTLSKAGSTNQIDLEDAASPARTSSQPPSFRISDGTLLRSTDSAQWHEAYPQDSELRFRAYATKGDQVWAGGNNATLVYSANGGGTWLKFKLEDSGEITDISIESGWRVATSTGAVFTSQDQGATWTKQP